MHPRLEAVVLGDMHVQGEEVDEGRRSNMCLPIAVSCFSICYLSYGRLIPHADRALRFSGCLAYDEEGRIRSDGYSARKLETLAIDLLYKTCRWITREKRSAFILYQRDNCFFCQLPSPYCPCVRCMQTCGSWSL
ncbi:hypothetical protein VPH35_124150 [Triticum aestivum]